jgi:hypothetical protein
VTPVLPKSTGTRSGGRCDSAARIRSFEVMEPPTLILR